MTRFHVLALAIGLSEAMLPSRAAADWPMARHDPLRTGLASGSSNITSPASYWRAYMGGSIAARGALAVDTNGDGKSDIVFIGGGKLFAREADNTEIWRTPLLNIVSLDGAVDVNGDGVLDIVGHSSSKVLIIDAGTGKLEWEEPTGEMGTIGGVRIADLNRDGLPDVYVQECGSCGLNSGKTGFAYSFAAGFAPAKQLWSAPFVAGGGQRAMTVADVDGDSHPELALASSTAFSVIDGPTGVVLATTPPLWTFMQWSACLPVDVDGAPGEELVCALSVRLAQDGNGHRLFLLHYSATPSPALSVVWQEDVGEVDGGLSYAPGMVADLDGDGLMEVTASGTTSAGATNTYVFDAATGAALAELPGETVVGTARLTSPTHSVLLTESGTTTSAWSFSRAAGQSVTLLWSLPDHAVLMNPDWELARKTWISSALVATDLSGDGVDDLLTQSVGAGISSIDAYSGPTGSLTPVGNYALPSGVEPLQSWVVQPVNRTYPQVMLASSDGFLKVFDNHLVPTENPGVRLGGFYASGDWNHLDSEPIVAKLGNATGQALLATDSSGALVRLDASNASFAVPPAKVWESSKTTGPVVLAPLDGSKPGIACWKLREPVSNPPEYQIAALRGDGSPIWIVPVDEQPLAGLLTGKLDSDGVPDLFVQWGHPTDTVLHLRGISGASGATLWNQAIVAGANREPAGAAAVDWNGDGRDDLVYQFYGTRVASGIDGQQIATHSDAVAYALPTLYDVNADGKLDVTLSGTASAAWTLDHDLATTLWQGPVNRPFPYGAIAACPGRPPELIEGSYANPSQLDITEVSGVAAGTAMHVVLGGGKSYPTLAASQAAGATLGQLMSVSVHENLTGAGRPSALVGSTDGWLYAVDPCDGTLDFSVAFGSPVGAVSFGDTDGDGLDEVLVSVADGYLYDLKQPPVAAPSFVWDTDPEHGITNADVDQIVTTDKLSAKWEAVAGATGYRVAIASADGSAYVTSPAWQDVGGVTATSLTGLPLIDGARYVFAVKSLQGTTASPDAVSNGVTVHFPMDGGIDAAPDAASDASADDAGPDSTADAGTEVPDTGADAPPDAQEENVGADAVDVQGGGCGCRVSGDRRPRNTLWLLAVCMAPAAALIRRGRRARLTRHDGSANRVD